MNVSDLSAVTRCAASMGYPSVVFGSSRGPRKEPHDTVWVAKAPDHDHLIYNPLDGLLCEVACMALIKQHQLCLVSLHAGRWECTWFNPSGEDEIRVESGSLNRAVVECVAQMWLATHPPSTDILERE